ncbi:hypothetical protein ACP70R_021031 [Stipagrostis hirtigluma subsp. patula]
MGDYGYAAMRNPDAGVQPRAKASNRANVIQQKLIGQSHPTGLTANLLKLFEPRPPLEYKPAVEKRKLPAYTGIAQFASLFAEPGDPEHAPPVVKCETRFAVLVLDVWFEYYILLYVQAEKKVRIHQLKIEQGAVKVAEELQKYDPQSDPNVTGDPYKTLFVARLVDGERKIKREFEAYGPVKKDELAVRLVTEKGTNKPRGYAFVEYVHTRDMKNTYKQADGRKVDNKRVLVDVERGRTVPNWRPRRLGGGLGSSRIGGKGADRKHADRVQQLAGRPRSEESRRNGRRADRLGENLVKDYGKGILMKEPTSARMTGVVIVYQWKKGATMEIVIGHGTRTERGTVRETVGVTLVVAVVIEVSTRIMVGQGPDAEYGSGDLRHERNMADYSQDYDYNNPYEQRKTHDAHGYGQDGQGHGTEGSKRHSHEYHREKSYSKMTANYQEQPNDSESEAPEEGKAYEEGGHQFHRADEYKN